MGFRVPMWARGYVDSDQAELDVRLSRAAPAPDSVPAGAVGNTPPVADDEDYTARPGQTLSVAAPGFLEGDTDADGDTVTAVAVVDNVDHGTLVGFADGHFTYTSELGFTGIDFFDYRISDGFGGFDVGRVTINVVNTNPVADDDAYAVHAGRTLSVAAPGFLDGDTDADGDTVVGTEVTDTVDHGTLVAFGPGNFRYTPDLGFTGVDFFDYRISDRFGGTDIGRVTITVFNTNPVADDDVYATPPGTTLDVAAPGFLDGDTDADGDTVVGTEVTDIVDHGTLVAFGPGNFRYTPDPGFTGVDFFEYRISDGVGGTDVGRVTIHVTNDPLTQTIRIGDAPERQTGAGGQWAAAWTHAGVGLLHKANAGNAAEPWSPVVLNGAGSGTLAGGDIYRGDLGVSGVALATSSVAAELDGAEALRVEVGSTGIGVRVSLSRLFAGDDATPFADSGVLRLLDASGFIVAQQPFRGTNAAGAALVTLNAPAGFVAVELVAGALDGTTFVPGGYANPDGSFGSAPFANASGLHGSDFMVDWIEVDVALTGVVPMGP